MNHVPSPDTSDAGIERLIQAKGKVAARVTPTDIEANIASEHYFTAGKFDSHSSDVVILRRDIASTEVMKPSLNLLTFCVLVLRNGFTVTGEAYCADPAKFNAEIGCIEAYQNAVQKIWPLMGYELRTKLAETNTYSND